MKKNFFVQFILAVFVVVLLGLGLHVFDSPNSNHEAPHNLGVGLIGMAVVILWFHHWFAAKLLRFSTIILVVIAFMAEPLLHVFGIPHPEGLWLPLLEGGAVVSALANYWNRIRATLDSWFRKLRNRLLKTPP